MTYCTDTETTLRSDVDRLTLDLRKANYHLDKERESRQDYQEALLKLKEDMNKGKTEFENMKVGVSQGQERRRVLLTCPRIAIRTYWHLSMETA